MIYTITLNPSLDYMVWLQELHVGKLHRSQREQVVVGGKGINVSRVLTNLAIDNIALGYVGGFVGQEIERQLQVFGQATDFIHLQEGLSRINIKLFGDDSKETQINGIGPLISAKEKEELKAKLSKLQSGDILVLSGNIPSTVENHDCFYQEICDFLSEKDIGLVVDCEGKSLLNTLSYKPFLIKPNKEELENILGKGIDTMDGVAQGAKILQRLGAQNVLVSMGEEGGLLLTKEGEILFQEAPKSKVISTIGAGDSMIAGFLAGIQKKNEQSKMDYHNFDYTRALKMGIAAGSGTAFSEYLATREQILELYSRL